MLKNNKKFFVILLFSVLLFSSVSTISLTTQYEPQSDFGGGTGTLADPYQIYYIEHLYNIRNNLTDNFILMNDLDFQDDSSYVNAANKTDNITGGGWLAIGNASSPFTGRLNGDNHTISNFYIYRHTRGNGLFNYTYDCSIEYLGLINVSVTGFASGDNHTGGFIAEMDYGHLKYCYISGNVSTGLVIGSFAGETYRSYIGNCYSIANVTENGGFKSGGIIGWATQTEIVNCFVSGDLSGSDEPIIGWDNGNTCTVTNTFYDNETTGHTTTDEGGTGKNTSDMQNILTFENVGWDICYNPNDLNNGYPYLAWQQDVSSFVWLIPSSGGSVYFISIDGKGNESYIYDSTPQFIWADVSSGVYWLQIANDSDFTDLVLNISNINVFNYPTQVMQMNNMVYFNVTTPFAYYKKYYTRVKAFSKE